MTGFDPTGDVPGTPENALEAREHAASDASTAADVAGSQIVPGMMFATSGARSARVKSRELDDALLPPEKRIGP